MPVILPERLPAAGRLAEENVFVMTRERASSQDIRPLEILELNLMPTKIETETQIARLLANSPLQVNLTLLQARDPRVDPCGGRAPRGLLHDAQDGPRPALRRHDHHGRARGDP